MWRFFACAFLALTIACARSPEDSAALERALASYRAASQSASDLSYRGPAWDAALAALREVPAEGPGAQRARVFIDEIESGRRDADAHRLSDAVPVAAPSPAPPSTAPVVEAVDPPHAGEQCFSSCSTSFSACVERAGCTARPKAGAGACKMKDGVPDSPGSCSMTGSCTTEASMHAAAECLRAQNQCAVACGGPSNTQACASLCDGKGEACYRRIDGCQGQGTTWTCPKEKTKEHAACAAEVTHCRDTCG
jgi:hypothetical protein